MKCGCAPFKNSCLVFTQHRTPNAIRLDAERNPIGRRTQSDRAADGIRSDCVRVTVKKAYDRNFSCLTNVIWQSYTSLLFFEDLHLQWWKETTQHHHLPYVRQLFRLVIGKGSKGRTDWAKSILAVGGKGEATEASGWAWVSDDRGNKEGDEHTMPNASIINAKINLISKKQYILLCF